MSSLTKPIMRKEFSFFNMSLQKQRLQSRALAHGFLGIHCGSRVAQPVGDVNIEQLDGFVRAVAKRQKQSKTGPL
jgi:hypothetical protein